MFDIGRVCIKIAGRDAGKKCVVISIVDDAYVMIDGETRRRKCNKLHLEPLNQTVDISENSSHLDVAKALSAEPRKTVTKQKADKPKKTRKVQEKTAVPDKKAKKSKK